MPNILIAISFIVSIVILSLVSSIYFISSLPADSSVRKRMIKLFSNHHLLPIVKLIYKFYFKIFYQTAALFFAQMVISSFIFIYGIYFRFYYYSKSNIIFDRTALCFILVAILLNCIYRSIIMLGEAILRFHSSLGLLGNYMTNKNALYEGYENSFGNYGNNKDILHKFGYLPPF